MQPGDDKLTLRHGDDNHNYSFDHVFGTGAVQEDLFKEVSGLVQSALDGYKVSIFAYGQTGSGKTHTMHGGEEPSSWGLIPRALEQIFKSSEEMRRKGWQWTLKASFVEVYNEVLRDLLRQDGATCTPQCHTIKHDADWGTMVTNLTCIDVASMEHIKSLMAKAARLRAVGGTDMNAVSSRSHSVFALYLSGSNHELNSELHGVLHLVDLAGSERLDRSGAEGDRLKETQNINRSLSSLADVFAAKAENRSHVPFRNSKLTHLMEPCLSGQGKTMMIVNVRPELDNSHETLCSLRFASQVSQCTTGGKPKRCAKSVAKPSGANVPGGMPIGTTPQGPASASGLKRRGYA
jgi:kinesin family protein C1